MIIRLNRLKTHKNIQTIWLPVAFDLNKQVHELIQNNKIPYILCPSVMNKKVRYP